jgi:hypothetical protein
MNHLIYERFEWYLVFTAELLLRLCCLPDQGVHFGGTKVSRIDFNHGAALAQSYKGAGASGASLDQFVFYVQ